ncbi:unnamed protein product [Penicillium bialowiezense]
MAHAPGRPRDQFSSAYGRFTVYGIERIEGSALREMFLSKMTPKGKKALRDDRDFVRSQLKHYGVDIDEHNCSGKGTNILKSALQAGKCDRVPDYISQLEKELHSKWLSQRSPEELADYPDWAMQSEYRSGKMMEAAKEVTGLHHKRAIGLQNQVIYMGWVKEDVEKAASGHCKQEGAALKAKENARTAKENARTSKQRKRHMDYLTSRSKNKSKVTPIGSYIVDSKEIKDQWPDAVEDMSIDIHATDTPGVFQGDFNFGVAEGVMFLCADESTLKEYCSRPEHDRGDEWYDSEDEETDYHDLQMNPEQGTKRSSKTSKSSQQTKKPKVEKGQALNYFLQLKSRETGEGEIDYQPNEGTLEFDDERLVSFSGDTDLSHVGECSFFARKVSDVPHPSGENWSNFSERAYNYACVARWH